MAYFSARALSHAIIPLAKKNTQKRGREQYAKKREKKKKKKKRRKDFLKVATSDLIRTKRAIINGVGVRLQGNTSGVRDSAVC